VVGEGEMRKRRKRIKDHKGENKLITGRYASGNKSVSL
jgi:hypothetical protein